MRDAASVAVAAERSPVRIALAGFIALVAVMGIGRFAYTPLLPMMQHDAGLTMTAAGWLAAANYLGYFVGALSAVWLHLPAGNVVRAGLVLNALLMMAMAWNAGFAWWWSVRAIAGVVSAWVLVYGSAMVIRQLAERGHVESSGIMFAGVGSGIALSGLLCIAFVSAGVNSSQSWLVLGVVALVGAVSVWPSFGAPAGAATPVSDPPGAARRWTSATVRLVIGYGLYGFGYVIPATFLPVIARDALEEPRLYVWFWPVCGIAAAISALWSGAWSRRFGDRNVLGACYVAEAIGVALPVLSAAPFAIALSALLLGATFVVITITALREVRRLAPSHAGPLIAAMTAAFALGQIVGPLLAAYAVERSGSFDAPLLAAAAALLLAYVLLPKRG